MINWKLRLKNKTTLSTLVSLTVAFVYQVLAQFGVTPAVSDDTVINAAAMVLNILAAMGTIVDPTTKGPGDSQQALTYQEPK